MNIGQTTQVLPMAVCEDLAPNILGNHGFALQIGQDLAESSILGSAQVFLAHILGQGLQFDNMM